MFKGLTLLLGIVLCIPVYCQTDCPQNLIQAQKLYEEGKIQEAIELIKPCADNGSAKDQWQANRLLAMCYLVNSQMEEARSAAVDMLKLNPTYTTNRLYDPAEFTKLLETITVIPKFSLGMTVSGGTNLTFAEVDRSFVLGNYIKSYEAISGIQIGSCFGFYIRPNLQLTAIANISNKRYSISYDPDDWRMNISEKLSYISLALSQEYIFRSTERLRPFVALGPNLSYLLYDRMTFNSERLNVEGEQYSLTKINVLNERNRWNYGILSSAGLYYKRKTGIWNMRLDYLYSLNQINKTDNRYSRLEQMYNFLYVDDDIKLHTMSLSFGYALFINYRVYDKN